MKLLDFFASATTRRSSQIADLEAKIAQATADFSAACAVDDDAAVKKANARKEALHADLRAVQAAIAETDRLAAEQRKAVAREAADLRLQQHADAVKHLRTTALAFEHSVTGTAAALWHELKAAGEQERAAAQAGGIEGFSKRGLHPQAIWTRVWMLFLRDVQDRGGAPLQMPSGGASHGQLTVAELFGKEPATSAPQGQKETA